MCGAEENPRDMGKFENAARGGGLDPGTSIDDPETNDASSEFDFCTLFNLLSSIEWLQLPRLLVVASELLFISVLS